MVGETQSQFEKRNYHLLVEHHLNVGLAQYTGVQDTHVHFMYNSYGKLDGSSKKKREVHFATLLNEAYQIGQAF